MDKAFVSKDTFVQVKHLCSVFAQLRGRTVWRFLSRKSVRAVFWLHTLYTLTSLKAGSSGVPKRETNGLKENLAGDMAFFLGRQFRRFFFTFQKINGKKVFRFTNVWLSLRKVAW